MLQVKPANMAWSHVGSGSSFAGQGHAGQRHGSVPAGSRPRSQGRVAGRQGGRSRDDCCFPWPLSPESPPGAFGGQEELNVLFYTNQYRPSVGIIRDVHNWFGDYRRLEQNHAYIQWLFPNYFDSRYNPEARALSRDEADVFRRNRDIAENLRRSYVMFLDFLGLRLLDPLSGLLGRATDTDAAGRLYEALVVHTHNQMRILRILSSLSVLGFRRYVLGLLSRLYWEVTGQDVCLALPSCLSQRDLQRYSRSQGPAREQPALRSLDGPRSPASKWLGYLPEAPDFQQNTRAMPEDMAESVLFQ